MRRKNPKMCITIIRNFRVHIQAEHVIGFFDRTEKSMYYQTGKTSWQLRFFLSMLHRMMKNTLATKNK